MCVCHVCVCNVKQTESNARITDIKEYSKKKTERGNRIIRPARESGKESETQLNLNQSHCMCACLFLEQIIFDKC